MKREKQQIIFWQETHLCDEEHEKCKCFGFKNTYYSSFGREHARGVAILISNKLTFLFSMQLTDTEGRYTLVKGHRQETCDTVKPL